MNGYIKLHRKIMEWEWYDDEVTFRLFVHLLLHANHNPNRWRGIDIDRGQVLTSTMHLADELNLSRKRVRTGMNHLISTGEVATKTTNKYTLVTILKWHVYQLDECEAGHQNGLRTGNQQASDGPATGQQRATNKKEKKEEKEKKEKKIYGAFANVELSDEEYEKLGPGADKDIEKLSAYMKSKGKAYKDHYATIENWRRMQQERAEKASNKSNFTPRDYTDEQLNAMYEEVQAP